MEVVPLRPLVARLLEVEVLEELLGRVLRGKVLNFRSTDRRTHATPRPEQVIPKEEKKPLSTWQKGLSFN